MNTHKYVNRAMSSMEHVTAPPQYEYTQGCQSIGGNRAMSSMENETKPSQHLIPQSKKYKLQVIMDRVYVEMNQQP